jgi:hypothetical protein
MIIALVAPYWLDQEPEQLRRAEACARVALSLDDHDAASHEAMGYVCQHQRTSGSSIWLRCISTAP